MSVIRDGDTYFISAMYYIQNQEYAVVSHALVGPEAVTILFLFSLLSSSVFRRLVCTMRA
jgi:hypothetical protein